MKQLRRATEADIARGEGLVYAVEYPVMVVCGSCGTTWSSEQPGEHKCPPPTPQSEMTLTPEQERDFGFLKAFLESEGETYLLERLARIRKALEEAQAPKYPDVEAGGAVFCGKCGARRIGDYAAYEPAVVMAHVPRLPLRRA